LAKFLSYWAIFELGRYLLLTGDAIFLIEGEFALDWGKKT